MAAPLFLLLLLLAMFTGSADAAFCVCKTGVPDQAMQAAIDYACAKGADCASASKGAPCYGNGVATLTGTDPSSGTCKFASGPRQHGLQRRRRPARRRAARGGCPRSRRRRRRTSPPLGAVPWQLGAGGHDTRRRDPASAARQRGLWSMSGVSACAYLMK
ncbi:PLASMODESMATA CALLOSE-BINDING PROTEIN 2 [Zea mays]|uniref:PLASMODESMATA CALLOSE-BINDING PROTEIN 2 n=2 Tax=Zea mays TaxID=4577 RepID=A0A1D6FT95_MAIZE|nr:PLASMODESMATA CALLOSE-BINDING PROTEIN 2 [Zea mays]